MPSKWHYFNALFMPVYPFMVPLLEQNECTLQDCHRLCQIPQKILDIDLCVSHFICKGLVYLTIKSKTITQLLSRFLKEKK